MSKYGDVDLYYYGIPILMNAGYSSCGNLELYSELCKVFYKNKDKCCDTDLGHETSKMSSLIPSRAYYLGIKRYLNKDLLKDIFTTFIKIDKHRIHLPTIEDTLDIITAITDIDARELYNSLK